MSLPGLQESRVKVLNDADVVEGRYVLYWMQQSQRADYNHALEFALLEANRLNLPLLVGFGLTDDYPEANLRHFRFMLEGLQETQRNLRKRGLGMTVERGDPAAVALRLAKEASLVVCDRGYLRHQKEWRHEVSANAGRRVVQVESDLVVPVEVASPKAEYAARTIRPKIQRRLSEFLIEPPVIPVSRPSLDLTEQGLDLTDVASLVNTLRTAQDVEEVPHFFRGGPGEGKRRFLDFLQVRLPDYARNRNQPQTDDVSAVSPYLHFGQLSPLYLALEARKRKEQAGDVDVFLEELLIRRELAANFVEYTDDYDDFSCLPSWASSTLHRHTVDPRKPVYGREVLEAAATHDPYWNAAMKEMLYTGFMHNYMRMYWGKKILEWSKTPEEAFQTCLFLNNKYFLDGRDPNSFTGVAWIFGVHDRPWGERPIFGTVRYMAASGLERKCDIRGYVEKVQRRIPASP